MRLAMIAVMGAMLVGALAVPGAFGDSAVLFAAAYAFVRMFQLVLFGIAARKIDGLFHAILNLAWGAIAGSTIVLSGQCGELALWRPGGEEHFWLSMAG